MLLDREYPEYDDDDLDDDWGLEEPNYLFDFIDFDEDEDDEPDDDAWELLMFGPNP